MQFVYKAMNDEGRVLDGELEAANSEDLEQRLQAMQLDMISCKEKHGQRFTLVQQNIQRQELINFCFYMEQLLRSGVPLLQGLNDLRDSISHQGFRNILTTIIEDIQAGKHLSEAMERHPKVFDTVFTNLINVGEESGELDKIFKHLTDALKWQDELIAQTKKVLTYPIVLGLTVIACITFLMTYLVPQLVNFIQNMGGQELPAHTKLLLWTSRLFTEQWPWLIAVPTSLVSMFMLALHFSEKARYWVDAYKLRIWVVGPLIEKVILARFASFFALMYASGITVLDSLNITRKIVGNRAIEAALRQVHTQITEGQGISESFSKSKLFPPLVVRMVNIGERTGELDTAMQNVSYFYNREVREGIERIQALIGPFLTLVLGGTLAWAIVSVLGPIYDILSDLPI